VTFPGSDPAVQPPVRKQRAGASGERAVRFICSALSYGGGQVACDSSRHEHERIRLAAMLQLFKGHGSCRREKLKIWKSRMATRGT